MCYNTTQITQSNSNSSSSSTIVIQFTAHPPTTYNIINITTILLVFCNIVYCIQPLFATTTSTTTTT